MMRSPRLQQRTRYFALAFLLAAIVVALGGTSFQRKIGTFQPLGFEAEARAGGAGNWQVTAVSRPGTGLEAGDWILGLGDLESLRQQPSTELTVIRGETPTDRPVTYRLPPLDIDGIYLVLTLVGLVYLLIGLYTALKDRHLHGRLFSLWCLTSAALYILTPPAATMGWVAGSIFAVDQLARLFLPPLTLHLFLVFPAGGSPTNLRRYIPFLYLPAAFLTILHLDMALNGGRWIAQGPLTPSRALLLDQIEIYLLVLFSLMAAIALGTRASRLRAGEQRWQLSWIVAGMVGAYASLLLLHLIPRSLDLGVPSWLTTMAVLPLGLIPLVFAYFILRHKMQDLGIILRDSITLSLTALIGIFAFSLFNVFLGRMLPAGEPLSKSLLTFIAGVSIAGVLVPTRSAVATGLERLQYRGSLGRRRALVELGQEILHERDLPRLCQTLVEGQKAGLGLARATLYLRDGDALLPMRPDVRLPTSMSLDALGPDFWSSEALGLSGMELVESKASSEQRLFRAGYRYAFPLTIEQGRGRHRVGVFLASYKEGGEALNSEDLDLARALLNQAALAIENAQLLADVQDQLAEVGRLREHNRGIIEASPAGIAVLDRGYRVVTANQAFATIAGLTSPEEASGKLEGSLPIRPLPRPEDGLVDISYCQLDGSERYLQVSVAEYRQEREDLWVLVVHDVSERVAIEGALREKERLASLGMLAAGVAHEVNTPLTGISSYAQLLLADTDESDPRYEILQKMERQTFRAAQIVNNLLEFARNRNDTIAPVALGRALTDCADSLEERASEAGCRIELSLAPEVGKVLGNEGELQQVFTNLILNAFDAMTPLGGGCLRIRGEAAGHRVRILLRDEGTGIPPERQERIFQPFFSSKLGKGGTGLGLAITYNIVRRHGGEIRVENHAESRGCTFIVELPRHEAVGGRRTGNTPPGIH